MSFWATRTGNSPSFKIEVDYEMDGKMVSGPPTTLAQ